VPNLISKRLFVYVRSINGKFGKIISLKFDRGDTNEP